MDIFQHSIYLFKLSLRHGASHLPSCYSAIPMTPNAYVKALTKITQCDFLLLEAHHLLLAAHEPP